VGGVAAARLGARAQELPLTREGALDLFAGTDGARGGITFTVSQLGRQVQELLREAFASVWVVGEVSRHRPSAAGHQYFDLVEKGEGDRIVGTLPAVVWKGEWVRLRPALERAGGKLAEGLALRCRVTLDFYPPGGRLQAQVREIDPSYTLGELERRRRETLEALAAAGLLEANRALELAALPLSLGLITSQGSAAYHDFVSTLAESGFGFHVTFVHAAVQGAEAEREVVSALALLGAAAVDAIVLVRGGGSKSDLAAFDSRAIAEAVARTPRPVLTGLGHEIDLAVADLVAHRAFKTPTKVAEFLVGRLADAEQAALALRRALARAGGLPLARARERLAGCERRLVAARARLARGERALAVVAWRLAGAARARLAAAAARLQGHERLVAGLAPARTLARGFSITRRADGALVRAPADAPAGSRLITQLAEGALASRVEEP
jgi:exodeoxyribonuclease VII large subunit